MSIISKSPTIKQEMGKKSHPQNTSVGGGSRPTSSKIKTETSAPAEPHKLGRAPGGALK